jgi:hypothetical protein
MTIATLGIDLAKSVFPPRRAGRPGQDRASSSHDPTATHHSDGDVAGLPDRDGGVLRRP